MVGGLLAMMLTAAGEAVTFDEAIAAVESLPRIVSARQAAGLVGEAAGALPWLQENPTLSFDPGLRVLAEPNRGVEVAAGITQGFSLSGEGRQARAVLDADAAHRRAMAAGEVLEARLAVAAAWLEVWALDQTFELAHQSLALAGEDRQRIDAGAKAQAFTSADVALARAHEASLRLALLDAEGALFDARIALALELGRTGSASVRGDPPAWPAPTGQLVAKLLDTAEALPEVQVELLASALASARVKEITARAGTRLQLGLFVVREAPEDLLAMVSTQLTLPIFDDGLRERAPAQADGAIQQGRVKQAIESARGRLRRADHEVRHAAQVLAVVEGELVPARVEHLRLVGLQFGAGAVTVVDKVRAEDLLLQAKARAARARADEAFARVRMLWLAQAIGGAAR